MQGLMKRNRYDMFHPSDSIPQLFDYDAFHDSYHPGIKRGHRRNKNKNQQRKLAEKYFASIFKRKMSSKSLTQN